MTALQIFDVEHGGCALLTCQNGMRMMIDCGHNATTDWYPGDHLRRLGVDYLDMLVVTNYDQDHVSGFPNLADQVSIGHIVRNTSVGPHVIRQLKSDEGIVSAAMDRFIDAISYQFGAPGTAAPLQFPGVDWATHRNSYPIFTDENNLSLVLRLRIGQITLIFPGDLETAGWQHLLSTSASFVRDAASATVLVAAHHGRSNGICAALFDDYGCRPEIVVISDDYRQYDTQDTTNYYRSKCKGIPNFRGKDRRHVLTTRRDGELTFRWGEFGCIVS